MLVRVAADDGASGVRVNSVRPGLTRTDLTTFMTGPRPVLDDYLSCMPLGRIGEPEDVAGLVRFCWARGVVDHRREHQRGRHAGAAARTCPACWRTVRRGRAPGLTPSPTPDPASDSANPVRAPAAPPTSGSPALRTPHHVAIAVARLHQHPDRQGLVALHERLVGHGDVLGEIGGREGTGRSVSWRGRARCRAAPRPPPPAPGP